MLVTMLTAMYMMVRVAEQFHMPHIMTKMLDMMKGLSHTTQLGVRWVRKQEPLPYVVSQPLPWQVHYVSHSRKGSRSEEFEGQRRNSIGVYRKNSSSSNGHTKTNAEKAAATIQNQYRKYQQKKQKDHK